MKKHTQYRRCLNCGKYVQAEAILHKYYCSANCARKYYTCKCCGKYFTRQKREDSTEFCSPICKAEFNVIISK